MNEMTRRFVVPDEFYRQQRSNWCRVAVGGLISWTFFLLATAGFDLLALIRDLNKFLPRGSNFDFEDQADMHSCTLDFIRFGSLPILLGCVAFMGIFMGRRLGVWYEVHPERLLGRLPYSRGVSQLNWELVNRINICKRADGSTLTLTVFSSECSPVIVIGISTTEMTELQELIRERVPAVTRWTASCIRITWDLPWAAPTAGAIMVSPIAAMWLILAVGNDFVLKMSVALLFAIGAFWLWVAKPVSRQQNELKSLETMLAICSLCVSGLVTLLMWSDSPQFRQLFDWLESLFL